MQFLGQKKATEKLERESGVSMQRTAMLIAGLVVSSLAIIGKAETSKADGGSVQTSLGHGIVLNEGSSLRREWVAIHDDLPVGRALPYRTIRALSGGAPAA